MADNTIALQARPMPQTNILTPITDVMNLGRAAVGLQRETEVPRHLIQHSLEVQGLIFGGGPGPVEFLGRLLLDGLELLLGSPVSCEFAIIQ